MIIDKNFEDKVLACLLGSDEFCCSAAPHLSASHFDGIIQHNIAKSCIDFHAKYAVKITKVGFVHAVKDMIEKKVLPEKDAGLYATEYKRLMSLDISDWKFILDQLIVFIKNKATKKLIEDAVTKHLPKNDFSTIESEMQKIAAIGTIAGVSPYQYFDEKSIDDRTKRREIESKEIVIGISTGIKKMDDVLPQKGFFKKNLYTFLAPPKRGKTMALQYFGNAAALQGFNVLMFTLETSTEVYSDRLDAMNANIEIRDLSRAFDVTAERLKSIKTNGNLLIYEYPTKRLSTVEIERQMRKLEVEDHFTTDMLIVDYADIMKPARHYQNKLDEQASIYEDLRALATVFGIPVLTASQVNRAGSDKEVITGKDTSGTWEKIMVSDAIISLSATDSDIRKNEMKIHFAECRNIPTKTIRIKTAYNFGRFYKEYVGEEYEMAF